MSRFFRASRSILGRYYKPAICMVSAASLYSLPTVCAATTMNNQKPMAIDTIKPNDKQTIKEMDAKDAIIDHYNKLELQMTESIQFEGNKLEIAVAMIPEVMQGLKSKEVLNFMEHTNKAVDTLLRAADLEKAIGKENLSTFRTLCIRHESLIIKAYNTISLLMIESSYQKSNIEDLLYELLMFKVKSSLTEQDAASFNDCISDLSDWVKQETLIKFWDECAFFQNEISEFADEIKKIQGKEEQQKLLNALTAMGGVVALLGAGLKIANEYKAAGFVQSAIKSYSGYDCDKETMDFIADSMIACGTSTAVAAYWYTDPTLSIQIFKEIRKISNKLSEMINDCKILRKDTELQTQQDAMNFYCEMLKKHGDSEKIRNGLYKVINCIEKYEEEGTKMLDGIGELRKRRMKS
eukprot:374885_1